MSEDTVVLYAEDDENDAFLMRHCWRKLGIRHPLQVVSDGEQAIQYLGAKPRPALVLLDLNMPRVGGMAVLKWVRADPGFAQLPVAILSSSNQKKDMDSAQALGVDAYFVKPANVSQLAELLAGVRQRWLPT